MYRGTILQIGTRIEVHSLVDQGCNSLQMEDAADQYLYYNEDTTELSIPASTISTPQLITDLQIASNSPEAATASEPEIVYPPIIATSQTLSHLDKLTTFFEALPVNELEPTGRHFITVPSAARQLRIYRS